MEKVTETDFSVKLRGGKSIGVTYLSVLCPTTIIGGGRGQLHREDGYRCAVPGLWGKNVCLPGLWAANF